MANVQTEDVKDLSLATPLPNGTNIDSFPVLAGGLLFLSTPDQLKKQLAGPGGGLSPTVTLVVPTAGLVGVPVSFVANPVATAPATVTKVEFYVGSRKVGQDTQAPYIYDYTPTTATQAGERPLVVTAVVTDSNMAQGTSSNYPLTVSAGAGIANQAPLIELSAPSSAVVGEDIPLIAYATDGDGAVQRVEFFNYSDKLGEVTVGTPYSFSYAAPTPGVYVFAAKATDDRGASNTTPGIAVQVTAVVVPVTPPGDAGPAYHGNVTTLTPSAGQVAALTAETWAAAVRDIAYPGDGNCPALWEPAAFPVRTLIQDQNQIDVTGDVQTSSLTVNGVVGRLYILVNPIFSTIHLIFN